ncbi:LLM class flavin-dependent oxidoreductase [Antrihabitans cavernicola]|uniref:LLM class flavin-dependent oxidoreductase n=1 Tax=Antrihabitans cavernicola TaxID=2495913 RepID=A0A5A7SHE6_9NOCA|nr:LLM class flavin-dependent oxidoreductase [Spelaeibacter cavernicola]KAA0024582.1 LLM class flavin-dependent oxidoreductase [Spelaeibacter cavernicola]
MIRTGLVDFGMHTRFSPDLLMRNSRTLAALIGAESLWTPDHLINVIPQSIFVPRYVGVSRIAPRAHACYEPWTELGYLAARNRLSRLLLGVSVTDAGRRHPAVTAQAAMTLHHLSRGRAILGIGVGERENNEPYGVDWSRPVARFVDALATVRALWNSGGAPVNRESEFFPLRDAVFDLPPYKGTRPPIWVASHGPRMLRATGRYADGWYPAFIRDPVEYERKLELVRAAASDAGRDPSTIVPALNLPIVVARSEDAVDEILDGVAAKAMALALPATDWSAHGVRHPLGDDFAGAQDFLPQTLDEATVLRHVETVPTSLLRSGAIMGTPESVVDQVAEWRDRGMRYFVPLDVSSLQPSLRRGLASTKPLVKAMRAIKRL